MASKFEEDYLAKRKAFLDYYAGPLSDENKEILFQEEVTQTAFEHWQKEQPSTIASSYLMKAEPQTHINPINPPCVISARTPQELAEIITDRDSDIRDLRNTLAKIYELVRGEDDNAGGTPYMTLGKIHDMTEEFKEDNE